MEISRRTFLHRALGAGAAVLVGCGAERREREDALARGELLEVLEWDASDPPQFGQRLGRGWDGRRFYDLRRLAPEAPSITPTDDFFLRTFAPATPASPPARWPIRIDGRVERPAAVDASDLVVRDLGAHVLECAGNDAFAQFGLIGCARWEGLPLLELLRAVEPRPDAVAVRVNGLDAHSEPSQRDHSKPGASWIFRFDELEQTRAFLATRMNGAPLARDHGHPVRLVVPGWYGCACMKWVDAISLVGADEPATSQMREFAGRTHQPGVPDLARDYRAASIDRAALPVRVERWRVRGESVLRVTGIAWGGTGAERDLQIRIRADGAWQPVAVSAPGSAGTPWSLWGHDFPPPGPGTYTIRCRFRGDVPQRRLAAGFYDRSVTIVS